MRNVHAVVIIAVVASITWLATLKIAPNRQITKVTVYDTVTVRTQIRKSATLCDPHTLEQIDGMNLYNDGLFHDVPRLVMQACLSAVTTEKRINER